MAFINFHISRKLHFYLLAAFSLLILLSAIVMAVVVILRSDRLVKQLDHSYQVNLGLERLMSTIKDAETGQRGYMLTDHSEFLSPYRQATPLVQGKLDDLSELLADDATQTENLDTLRKYVTDELTVLAAMKNRFDEEGSLDDSIKAMIVVGKLKMDEIRDWMQIISNRERQRLNIRQSGMYASSRHSVYIIIITSGISILLLIGLLIFLNNEIYRKRKAEIGLRRSQIVLEEQIHALHQLNRELEQFAYVASHDLQEPLRKIISFSERIENRLKEYPDEEVHDYINRLNRSSYRMRTLIQDLLSYSRATRIPDTDEQVNVGQMIREILDDMELVADGKTVHVQQGILGPVLGNDTQLRQVFQNLLSNALKFNHNSEPQISIWEETRNLPDIMAHGWGKGFGLKHKHYTCYFIKDNGIGFDAATYLKQIFVIFQRLHGRTEYEGTGIGLAICKRIIENHQGFITADSEPGKGALFIIGLPIKNHDNTTEK